MLKGWLNDNHNKTGANFKSCRLRIILSSFYMYKGRAQYVSLHSKIYNAGKV